MWEIYGEIGCCYGHWRAAIVASTRDCCALLPTRTWMAKSCSGLWGRVADASVSDVPRSCRGVPGSSRGVAAGAP